MKIPHKTEAVKNLLKLLELCGEKWFYGTNLCYGLLLSVNRNDQSLQFSSGLRISRDELDIDLFYEIAWRIVGIAGIFGDSFAAERGEDWDYRFPMDAEDNFYFILNDKSKSNKHVISVTWFDSRWPDGTVVDCSALFLLFSQDDFIRLLCDYIGLKKEDLFHEDTGI